MASAVGWDFGGEVSMGMMVGMVGATIGADVGGEGRIGEEAGEGRMGEGGKSEMEGMDVCEGARRFQLSGASTGERANAASRLLGVLGVMGRIVVILLLVGLGYCEEA